MIRQNALSALADQVAAPMPPGQGRKLDVFQAAAAFALAGTDAIVFRIWEAIW
jgi:hypothetical protein